MTEREARVIFTGLLAELVLWIRDTLKVDVAIDEATIHSPRAGRLNGIKVNVDDAVHIATSYHHRGRAADLLIYMDKDGDASNGAEAYIADGKDPVWLKIAHKWESMHALCTSGIRWNDANHVSFGEGSKATPLPPLPTIIATSAA